MISKKIEGLGISVNTATQEMALPNERVKNLLARLAAVCSMAVPGLSAREANSLFSLLRQATGVIRQCMAFVPKLREAMTAVDVGQIRLSEVLVLPLFWFLILLVIRRPRWLRCAGFATRCVRRTGDRTSIGRSRRASNSDRCRTLR